MWKLVSLNSFFLCTPHAVAIFKRLSTSVTGKKEKNPSLFFKKPCRKEADGNHCEYPTSPLTWESGKKLWPEKKEKSRASKTNWPQSKAAYVRFPVLLLLLPRRVLWLCLHELTLTLLRSGLWGSYQWAKPDALSLGNLATHSCAAPAASHINGRAAPQKRRSVMFFFFL